MLTRTFVILLGLAAVSQSHAQVLKMPQASPASTVVQEIGISTVTVTYHSPAARNRAVWGGLVPYGVTPPFPWGSKHDNPWRAGANENTTISFSHDAKIEGKPIAAGTYGLHMIPTEKDWTIIFSKNSTSWGSFYYEPSEDALRVVVTPVAVNDHRENLAYGFDQMTNTTGTVYLHWEKLRVPFKIEFDTPSIVLANLKNDMRGQAGFNQANLIQAANWCLQNNVNLEEAMSWVDRAILFGAGTNAQLVKSAFLAALGKKDEAATMKKNALDAATENELNNYGYQLMGTKKVDEAIEVFQLNVKKYPKSWNCYDSLGEALASKGNTKDAIANYKKAQQMTTDEAQKKRIQGILDSLQNKL
jgi:hypothetical protein